MRILLFSGGIDSTCLAWSFRPDRLLFIDYGQLAAKGEKRAAEAIASALDLRLDSRAADLRGFGHGTMTGQPALSDLAPEFWPFRNQMLVTLAAMAYADLPVNSIMIGSVAGDEVHPDGTAAFRTSMKNLLRTQTSAMLEAPAAEVRTEDLIRQFGVPASLLGWTFSCHTGEWACGTCRGCRKHDEIMRSVIMPEVKTDGR